MAEPFSQIGALIVRYIAKLKITLPVNCALHSMVQIKVQCSALKYRTAHYNTVKCSALHSTQYQYKRVLYSVMKCSAKQCSAKQLSAVQFSLA